MTVELFWNSHIQKSLFLDFLLNFRIIIVTSITAVSKVRKSLNFNFTIIERFKNMRKFLKISLSPSLWKYSNCLGIQNAGWVFLYIENGRLCGGALFLLICFRSPQLGSLWRPFWTFYHQLKITDYWNILDLASFAKFSIIRIFGLSEFRL